MNETEPLGAVFLIPDSVIADEHSADRLNNICVRYEEGKITLKRQEKLLQGEIRSGRMTSNPEALRVECTRVTRGLLLEFRTVLGDKLSADVFYALASRFEARSI